MSENLILWRTIKCSLLLRCPLLFHSCRRGKVSRLAVDMQEQYFFAIQQIQKNRICLLQKYIIKVTSREIIKNIIKNNFDQERLNLSIICFRILSLNEATCSGVSFCCSWTSESYPDSLSEESYTSQFQTGMWIIFSASSACFQFTCIGSLGSLRTCSCQSIFASRLGITVYLALSSFCLPRISFLLLILCKFLLHCSLYSRLALILVLFIKLQIFSFFISSSSLTRSASICAMLQNQSMGYIGIHVAGDVTIFGTFDYFRFQACEGCRVVGWAQIVHGIGMEFEFYLLLLNKELLDHLGSWLALTIEPTDAQVLTQALSFNSEDLANLPTFPWLLILLSYCSIIRFCSKIIFFNFSI